MDVTIFIKNFYYANQSRTYHVTNLITRLKIVSQKRLHLYRFEIGGQCSDAQKGVLGCVNLATIL